MTGPNRRAVLVGLACTWVSRAFAAGPSERQVELFSRWHAARRRGVPLLVIVIPDAGEWARGRVVGAALVEADDDLSSALGGHEGVCATVADLRLLGVEVPTSAWFVRIGVEVPAAVEWRDGPTVGPDDLDELNGPIDAVVRMLRAWLPPDPRPGAAADGRTRWVDEAVPGSHWAIGGGCGLTIEGVDQGSMNYSCGMGHVPRRAVRFLYFADLR